MTRTQTDKSDRAPSKKSPKTVVQLGDGDGESKKYPKNSFVVDTICVGEPVFDMNLELERWSGSPSTRMGLGKQE